MTVTTFEEALKEEAGMNQGEKLVCSSEQRLWLDSDNKDELKINCEIRTDRILSDREGKCVTVFFPELLQIKERKEQFQKGNSSFGP